MLDFRYIKNSTNEEWIETSLSGKPLLTSPQLNKGTAFPENERHLFGLLGKLPPQVETLEEQAVRAYEQFNAYEGDLLQKHIYLYNLHDKNQVLFYKLVRDHLAEMMPLIYTPIVGAAVQEFSQQFRQPRGLYIAYPYRNYIKEILKNRTNPDISLIVVTDGEGVLGIGDQGVGGMDISIAKLMVYTLCGNVNPLNTLPIQLDVGTNNQKLLNDPSYLGWRHERIQGAEYDAFVDEFLDAIQSQFPNAFLHWEDLGRDNAKRILDRSRQKMCAFNDDIQGTGAVTLAAILAAVKANQSTLAEQRIVIFGAGSAGTGIADQISAGMSFQGMSEEEAKRHFWLIDRQGLLTEDSIHITPEQQPYIRKHDEVASWPQSPLNTISLLETIKNIKPTILIGCSGQSNAFTQEIINEMAQHAPHPIIFALSNPTENCEAHPLDILHWTQGKAHIATGSPFQDVLFNGKNVRIAQCNNAFIFPGIGLGVLAVQAKQLSNAMVMAASEALSEFIPLSKDSIVPLLPALTEAQDVAHKIAFAVATQAIKEGLGTIAEGETIEKTINNLLWLPHYCAFHLIK